MTDFQLPVNLPEDLEHYIIRKANKEGVSMSEIVRRALRAQYAMDKFHEGLNDESR